MCTAQAGQFGSAPDFAELLRGPASECVLAGDVLLAACHSSIGQAKQARVESGARATHRRMRRNQAIGRKMIAVFVVTADDGPSRSSNPTVKEALQIPIRRFATRQAGYDHRLR